MTFWTEKSYLPKKCMVGKGSRLNIFDELKELVEINSYTFNKEGVNKNGDIYKDKMSKIGFVYDEYKREHIGNHLLFKSQKKEGKKVLLVGHLDTVFPEGSFEGYKEDSKWVYGPGVCDMKGGNLVAIESLRRIYKEKGSVSNIDLFLVSDEEKGSLDSSKITEKLSKEYSYALVFEAAGKNMEIVTSRKGSGAFEIEIKGKAAHAGNDYMLGVDANLEASYKLQELVKLTDLGKGTTVNVGKIEGGRGANTISPYAKLTFEIRYTSKDERDRVLNEIKRIVQTSFVEGSSAVLSGGIERDVMEESESQKDFVKLLEKIIGKKLPTEKRGGVSDANIIASQGVPVLDGFGPFGDGDHTLKERALKSSFFERIDLTCKVLEELTS